MERRSQVTIVSLYARVSSQKQAQENTIKSQIAELEECISNDRHELLDEYKFIDNGCSGSNLVRPGLECLRDKAAEGKINKIYIHSPDRLSRKFAYQMILMEEFQKAGAEVIFLNHQINDSPESNLLLQMQGAIAEFERAKIMERNRRGKLYAAKRGSTNILAGAPYGYYYINRHMGGGESKFEINEEEAEIVRKLFIWVGRDRVSMRETARRLSEMFIATQTGKKYWHPSTVWKILRNPAYKGQAAFGKTKVCPKLKGIKSKRGTQSKRSNSILNTDKESWIYVKVPSIIDEGLFDIVQEQLAENRKRVRAQRRKETYLLQSLVVCQHCQYSYCGTMSSIKKINKIFYYYRCIGLNFNHFHGNKICNSKGIRAETLDTIVWNEVKSLLEKPDRIVKEYQLRLSEQKDRPLNDTFEKQESKLKRGIANLIDSYAQELISKEEFEPRIKAMKQRLKEIEEQKEKVLDHKKLQQEFNLITSSLEEFSASIKSELDQVDWQTKRHIIRTLVKQIEISYDNIYIVFRVKELANEAVNQNLQYCRRSPKIVDLKT
jgi:site-specific DNA recombinase